MVIAAAVIIGIALVGGVVILAAVAEYYLSRRNGVRRR